MDDTVAPPAKRSGRSSGVLLESGRTTWRELLVVAGLLAALAAGMLGPRIAHGSFSNDDWSYLVLAHYPGPSGAVAAFDYLWFRPLMVLWFPATFSVLGTSAGPHLAFLGAVCVVESLLIYAVVRQLGAERLFAGVLAGMALILPLQDSTRLWVCMNANVGAVTLWLGAVLVSLEAFRHVGRRAIILHATATVLLLASISLYEIGAAVALVSGGLFVLQQGRRALVPWATQALAISLLLVLVTSHTFYTPLRGRMLVRHAGTVASDAPRALADAVWAPGEPTTAAGLATCIVIALVLLTATVALRRGTLTEPAHDVVRRWLRLAGVAVVVAAAGWAMIVPSSYLSPMLPGQLNRGNVVAGPALVLLVVSTVVVATALVLQRQPALERLAALVALAVLAVVATGYTVQFRRDVRTWNGASDQQRMIVDLIDARLPRLPPGSTVMTADAATDVSPEVPVFAAPWDLSGALALRRGDASISAYPFISGSQLECARHAVVLHNGNDVFGPQEGQYGRTWFVDVGARSVRRVINRTACAAS